MAGKNKLRQDQRRTPRSRGHDLRQVAKTVSIGAIILVWLVVLMWYFKGDSQLERECVTLRRFEDTLRSEVLKSTDGAKDWALAVKNAVENTSKLKQKIPTDALNDVIAAMQLVHGAATADNSTEIQVRTYGEALCNKLAHALDESACLPFQPSQRAAA